MKLAVFGSETADGLRFVKYAMRIGYDIQVLISDRDVLYTSQSRKLRKIIESYNQSDIDECISGCDAVVVLINKTADRRRLELILKAIDHSSIFRLLVCENIRTQSDYDDFNALAASLADVSVDWTIIKPIPNDTSEVIKQLGELSHNQSKICRSLEGFIVDQVTDSRYLGTTVMITS